MAGDAGSSLLPLDRVGAAIFLHAVGAGSMVRWRDQFAGHAEMRSIKVASSAGAHEIHGLIGAYPDPCPSRDSYPLVAMMQSGQDRCGDDVPCSLDGSS
jgi:hypothetical protein